MINLLHKQDDVIACFLTDLKTTLRIDDQFKAHDTTFALNANRH